MSQNTSFTDENFTFILSPLNFTKIKEIKKVPSSPELITKFSKNCPNDKKYDNFYKERDKISKNTNTNSTSITTNITSTNSNSNNNIVDDKERNKIYNNLTNILSQFLMDEELLMNSNFVPRALIKNAQLQKNMNNSNNNSKNCQSIINENTGNICKYLFLAKNEKESLLPFIIDQNKNNLSYEKCYYYKKLSENIVSFYNEIIYNNEIIFPLKKKLNSIVLKIINQSINTTLKPYNIINLIIYGSQASGLSLPESDIDLLLIYYDSNNSLEMLINELYKCLQMSKKFQNVTSLPKASSPLIKIEYKANIDEMDISILHMDISFHNIFPNKATIYFTPSLLIVKYIQRSIEYLPQSKNIIILIKKYLKNIGLNNYYTGGLSSFSIFLLVFSFYKYIIKLFGNEVVNNYYIGQFLIQFLDFYSKFNFSDYIININKEIPFIIKEKRNNNENKPKTSNNDCNINKNNKIQYINENNIANAVILDPFTLNNIASNSFRIIEIQQKFDSLKNNLLVNFEKTYKIKNLYKIIYNKGKYKSKDSYHFQCKCYNNKLKGDYFSSKNEEKIISEISFEEYEKENDLLNNNKSPNFLELSIK
jgi:DNA polymerase sigma